jgi:hypothetical protein
MRARLRSEDETRLAPLSIVGGGSAGEAASKDLLGRKGQHSCLQASSLALLTLPAIVRKIRTARATNPSERHTHE